MGATRRVLGLPLLRQVSVAVMETSFLAHRSGRIFGPETLEDNWYEDREQFVVGEVGGKLIPKDVKGGFTRRGYETHFSSAPRRNIRRDFMGLSRTLTDHPERSLETTTRSDFVVPEREVDRPKQSLVRVDTFKHTKNPRPTDTSQDGGMWSTHPRHPEDYGQRYFDTTTQTELDNGLKPREDLVLPPVGEGQGDVCRGGHEKASTNFHVFPFGHAKNNFYCTPGNRNIFNRTSSMISRGAAPSPTAESEQGDEPKRFGRRYAFTGMARRAGARVFYDENVE